MPSKKKIAAIPASVTAEELADLVGLSERRVFQFAADGIIHKPAKHAEGYPLRDSLRRICEHYREQAAGLPAKTATSRARTADAEADSAEMKAAREADLLMLRSDAKRLWENGFVKVRTIIARDRNIPARTKKELGEKLARLKLDEE